MKPWGTVAILFLLLSTGILLTNGRAVDQERKPSKEIPTEVKAGMFSPIQKEHSKLYGRYQLGRRLDALATRLKPGQEDGVFIEAPLEVMANDAAAITFKDLIKNLVCEADVIAIVSPKEKSSQLTENREFIFTDYLVFVDEIFKNNAKTTIHPFSQIIVSRPGGKVSIDGRILSALDSSYQPLEFGEQYLLFLKYIPQTNAYESIAKGGFLLKETVLVPLTEQYIPKDDGAPNLTNNSLRTILLSPCSK